MSLAFSDYLSITALAVSVISVRYTKHQRDSARVANQNNYRAQLSDNHKKYRKALKRVTKKHKEELDNLSQEAGKALTSIVNVFDNYDVKGHTPRYLRHLVHECSEMIYYIFEEQLGWQSGRRISHSFYQMTHLEDRLKPKSKYFQPDVFHGVFEDRDFADSKIYQETELLSNIYFCSLVNQIKERVDYARCAELLADIQEILKPFNILHENIRPKVAKSASYLKEKIEESEHEHFKLRESPELLGQMNYQQTILDTLDHLRIPYIDEEYREKYYNYISLCLYTCAVLHAIQSLHSWGWNRRG